MLLKDKIRLPKTLSFKLTLWYFFIFFFSILAGFLIFNFLLSSNLNKELDENLKNEAREIELLLERKGINKVRMAVTLETESEGVEKIFIRIMNMRGKTLIASDDTNWKIEANKKVIEFIAGGSKSFFETISAPEKPHKVRVLYSRLGSRYILQIMASMEDSARVIKISRQTFFMIMGFMLLLSSIAGGFMARRALAGVEKVTQTAIQVAEGDFDKRVNAAGYGEEIDRLATTFNNMLERLHILIRDIKEINDNIAHDLRSPVTRIRGIAETTLMSDNADPESQAMAGSIIEECDGLLTMINTMLEISEAEAGVSRLKIEEINLHKILREACDLFQPVAEAKRIDIRQMMEESAMIQGDKGKIQRAVANLLDNAIKYTPEGGTVSVSSERSHNKVTVSIKDNGIGMSEEDLPKIFNRFYRCDQSRSLQGVGLGLSLARAIVNIHHGKISVFSTPGEGSTFTFTIPVIHQP